MDRLRSLNPADGSEVVSVPVTPIADLPLSLAAARLAQAGWRRLSPSERAEILAPVGEALLARADELGRLISLEMGKPLREATGEVRGIASGWREELAELADAFTPDVLEDAHTRSWVYHDPFGVCAAITRGISPLACPIRWCCPPSWPGTRCC